MVPSQFTPLFRSEMGRNILIVAGEPSGDLIAGELVAALKFHLPDLTYWGIGGRRMAEEDVELVERVENLSVVGITELFRKLRLIPRQYYGLLADAESRRPEVAILVDYPGFNLKLAKPLRRMGIPVVYYVIPQVWAWGSFRTRILRKHVNKALVLFQFEKELLDREGVDCAFAGHPIVDRVIEAGPWSDGTLSEEIVVGLLPGSRRSEVTDLLPRMLAAASIIARKREARFVLGESSSVDSAIYDSIVAEKGGLVLERLRDDTLACLRRSDLVIVASGTATLEAAAARRPMIITYRTAMLNAPGRRLVLKTPFLGLVNIVAGREIVPELIQKEATGERMAREVLALVNDTARVERMRAELQAVADSLGPAGASRRAALEIVGFLESRRRPREKRPASG
jgi:lipid-A-disaccharide synthase